MSEDGLLTGADDSASIAEGSADIFASVPREVRFSNDGNDKLARFKDNNTLLATSYLEQEKMNSGRVNMLTDESTDEDVSAFYQKLPEKYRAPDTAEGYGQLEGENVPESDKAYFSVMTNAALANNMPPDAFNGLMKAHTEYMNAKITSDTNMTEEALQKEWVGDYDKNIEIVERVFREAPEGVDGTAFKSWFNSVGGGRNEVAMKAMLAIGKSTLDDNYVEGDRVPEKLDDYKPQYTSSPEMYRNGDDEESVKGRAWHTKQGFVY